MGWRITAEVGRFDEALDHLAGRVALSDEERRTMPTDARSRAFWIAGVAQLDVLQTVQDKLAKAIEQGTSIEDFKRSVRDELSKAWGGDNPSRIETIYRNATQTAYNAGRWQQMMDPAVKRFRPYLMYDAVLDARTTPLCQGLSGTVLGADDPWWDRHWPPLHHRCRSSVRSLRAAEAERRGLTQEPSTESPPGGFGLSPRLATEWHPPAEGRDARLMAELERKRQELALRPAPPPMPKTLAPVAPRLSEPPPLRETVRTGQFTEAPLSPAQAKAHQTAERLRGSYEARAQASYEDRRTWMLWEWVRGSNRKTSAIMKVAALREFGLTGVPWSRGIGYRMQEADVTRAARDLRRLHGDTQAWFKRRGIRTVTLFRGVHGDAPDARNTIESWTADEEVAKRFAARGPNGRVLRITVPVTQVLAHHRLGDWLDGPWGAQAEYLVLW